MNNEPVAWLRYENEHWRLDFPMVRFYTNVETPEIPLYTTPELARKLHPAKTLTDEKDTECQFCKQGCIRCDARKLLTDEEILQEAWYILATQWQRKAQEK